MNQKLPPVVNRKSSGPRKTRGRSPEFEEAFTRSDLSKLANYQRFLLVCILAYVTGVVFTLTGAVSQDAMAPIFGAIALLALVGVLLVASHLHGIVNGIILAVFSIVPFIGLVILLITNQRATSVLKAHGIDVGLLGAKGKI